MHSAEYVTDIQQIFKFYWNQFGIHLDFEAASKFIQTMCVTET